TEVSPEVRLERADGHPPAVLGLVEGVARVLTGEHGLAASLRRALSKLRQDVDHLPRHRPVHHGDVDELAFAGLLAREERAQDAGRGHEGATADVRDLDAGYRGLAAAHAGQVDHAREAE